MSFPASLTTRTVKGRFVTYPDGAAAKGTVRFVLADFMQGPIDDAIVAPFDITIDLDANGAFETVLPATDDPQWTPSVYKVTITTESKFKTYNAVVDKVENKILRDKIVVPYNQTGPLDLADVLNIPAPVPGLSYIVAAAKGAPGGVASLNESGQLETSQIPDELDVAVSWDDVQDKPATFPHDEVTYAEILDKPSTFPPSAHEHVTEDVAGLDAALAGKASTTALTSGLASKADTSALTAKADVSALTTGLAGKANASHTHPTAQVTGLDSALAGKASTTDLTDGLAGKANTVHTHAQSQVTGLTTSLAGKANTVHGHVTSDVSGLDTALAGKSNTGHTHSTSDVASLDTALASKSPIGHTHAYSTLTGVPSTFAPSAHEHALDDVMGLDEALADKADVSALDDYATNDYLTDGLAGKADVSALTSGLGTKADATFVTSSLATKADLVGGVIPTSQIPSISIVDFLGSISTQSAMLALTGQKGDWAIRSDLGQTWVITGSDPTQLASWTSMPVGTSGGGAVDSVNGQVGVVVLGKADIGLGNVDNTADTAKPVSTAQQTALNAKAPLASPTFTGTVAGISASMVGLGNVDNTADTAKPVSTAQQTALNAKAPLASPAFTGTPTGITKTHVGLGNVDNTADTAKPVSTAQQTALNLKANLASPTFTGTVAGVTSAMVGLGNVDNTSDVNKPVSTAQSTALALKAPLASPAFTGTPTGITKTHVGLGNVDNTTDLTKPISTPQKSYVQSRGDNLFANGSGMLADNTNMSAFTFSRETHGGAGSFLVNVAQQAKTSDELIPVDPTKGYRLSVWARSGDDNGGNYTAANNQYIGLVVYDALGNFMDYSHRSETNPTAVKTTLAVDLVAGATTMTLTDATGWYNGTTSAWRHFSWWPYVDANGTSFPAYTYSRNQGMQRVTGASTNGVWASGGISGNVITLTAPWTGTTVPAGSPVANFGAGGSYLYCALANGAIPNTWKQYTATLFGQNVSRSGSRDGLMLPQGAAYVRFLALINYHGVANNNVRFSDITFTEHGSLGESTRARRAILTPSSGSTFYMLSSSYNGHLLGVDEGTIFIDCSTGSKTIVLPDPAVGPLNPIEWTFVRIDSNAAATVTFLPTVPSTINGSTGSYAGPTKSGGAVQFTHDGTGWWVSGSPVQTVNGQAGTVVLAKTDVGLANVDNTADTAKPVSTAQQTALNLKANLASPTFTGTVAGVTSAMVGLGNVDNTSDVNKPVSTAQQTALNAKAPLASPAFTGTPTGITKTHVGLSNVDNTADTAKPVSTAQQTALDLKADATALAAKAPLASPAFTGTPTGITKTHVGLGNVDNTADTTKPVSTAQQAALDLKAPLTSPTFTGTVTGVSKSMVGLSNVDNTADTAKPVSTAQQTALDLKADASSVTSALASKADLVGGVLTTSQIPAISVVDFLGSVSTQAAMLALTGQKGDWAIRTDLGQSWVITGSNPTLLSSWTAMPIAAVPVQTVNGQTGAVVLGKTDIGLGNVDNTADTAKPVSTAQQTALDLKAPLASPTFTGTVAGVTASMVGLGSVNNTADSAKPVSTAQQAALDLKAPLASPTFTGTVAGVSKSMVGLGNVDNTADTAKPVSTAQQTALDLKADASALAAKAPLASPTFTGTVAGVTKSMVGLGSVDNTADTAKPVSTAQQAALDLKAPLASPTFTGTVAGVTKTHVGLSNVDNTADTAKPVSTAQQTALDLKADATALAAKAPLASPAFTGTPTGITKTHVGLGNVDNTADTAKPVSTAQQTALDLKADASALAAKAPLASPTFTGTVAGITKSMVGLANVDNTADTAKPVSTAQQTALDLKADASALAAKAPLASPTFTGTVAGVTASMVGLGNVTNTSDASKPVSTAQQAALDLKANLASPTFTGTVAGITKSMVGLANVDNTADTAKPVSTAQQTALDLKAPLASPTLTGTPAAPTASAGTSTTQLATTAFVGTAVSNNSPKVIVLASGAAVPGGTPAGTIIIRTP